jgi:hypothetical protein
MHDALRRLARAITGTTPEDEEAQLQAIIRVPAIRDKIQNTATGTEAARAVGDGVAPSSSEAEQAVKAEPQPSPRRAASSPKGAAGPPAAPPKDRG